MTDRSITHTLYCAAGVVAAGVTAYFAVPRIKASLHAARLKKKAKKPEESDSCSETSERETLKMPTVITEEQHRERILRRKQMRASKQTRKTMAVPIFHISTDLPRHKDFNSINYVKVYLESLDSKPYHESAVTVSEYANKVFSAVCALCGSSENPIMRRKLMEVNFRQALKKSIALGYLETESQDVRMTPYHYYLLVDIFH